MKDPSGRLGILATQDAEQPVALTFEWDGQKEAANRRKHRIGFDEASTVFGDPRSITIPDPAHSQVEDRFILLGESYRGRLLVVVHVQRGENLRLISARTATPGERRTYEQE